jgi:hypothetical protein
LALVLLGAAGPAPVVQPTRDVDVTYKVPVPGQADTAMLQRLRFSAVLHRQRLDLPTSGNWMVIDFSAHRMAMVRDESREVVDLPAPPTAVLPGGGNGFTLVGPGIVAGLACTEWRTHDVRGGESAVCYTDDGVLLRARQGDRVLMEATRVVYAAQGEAVFKAPEGYSHQVRE